MNGFFRDAKGRRKPMADVPDDSGPIMAIASITLGGKPTKENPLPFKQIAIELYQPISGGLSIGGRFAPEKMKVPARKDQPAKWQAAAEMGRGAKCAATPSPPLAQVAMGPRCGGLSRSSGTVG